MSGLLAITDGQVHRWSDVAGLVLVASLSALLVRLDLDRLGGEPAVRARLLGAAACGTLLAVVLVIRFADLSGG